MNAPKRVIARAALAACVTLSMIGSIAPGGAQAKTVRKPTPISKLPDWNGLWEKDGHLGFDPRIPIGTPQVPPYTPEYMKEYVKVREASRAARPIADNGASCIPNGMPGILSSPFPMEIEINPSVTVMIIEGPNSPRRIYTDGRPHPTDVVLPQTNGHSIGYWKNKELFVDTCCFKDTTRLPGGGPHSDAMHITEHYWAPDSKTLKAEVIVTDPKAFTKPWSAVKTWHRRPDWEANEYICNENNRNPIGPDGVTTVILPGDANK